jgi:hypothetical protein
MDMQSDCLEEVLKCWLELGANINHSDERDVTPLIGVQWSPAWGVWRYMLLLIKYGADVHRVDAKEKSGPLHTALKSLHVAYQSSFLLLPTRPHVAEVEARLIVLLEAGCDPNAINSQGRTPPDCVKRDGPAWAVWNQALARVEYRKSLRPNEREADLLCRAVPTARSSAVYYEC